MTDDGKTDKLEGLLKDTIQFMAGACKSFDDELTGEGFRLASCIRMLVNDTEKGRSLLSRLGLKGMFFYDICPEYNPGFDLPFSGLAIVVIGGGQSLKKYVARLDDSPHVPQKKVSFDAWWNKPVIVDQKKNISITRKALILSVANTAVGPVNIKLTGQYQRIMESYTIDYDKEGIYGVEPDMVAVEFASARHVAFEILRSIEDQFKNFCEQPANQP